MADTISDKLVRLNEVKQQIKQSIIDKGVQVVDTDPFSAYPDKIGQISGGGGDATFLGLGFDQWVGALDENGTLKKAPNTIKFNAAGIRDVESFVFAYRLTNTDVQSVNFPDLTTISGSVACYKMFGGCKEVTSVGLNNLRTVDGSNACYEMFYGCSKLTSAMLENLTTISGGYGCYYMFGNCDNLISARLKNLTTISGEYGCGWLFYSCPNLVDAGLGNLTTISGRYACQRMFDGCKQLMSAGLENLTTISGQWACQYMFNGCTGLTKEYFPMLTVFGYNNVFGTTSTNYIFTRCINITELHFRADTQSVIEGLTGYSAKFGAINATIYFDLIGTITVSGVAYARDEKQSIRVDGVKTFVGWKDADGNVVYTSYAGNAEPAVGTVVYSDAGTTQVGTVEGVA